jgi:hypothetical protein
MLEKDESSAFEEGNVGDAEFLLMRSAIGTLFWMQGRARKSWLPISFD